MRQRSDDEACDPGGGAVDRGLPEQHDVAAGEVDVLVRSIVSRRRTGARTVPGGVDVGHVDRQRHERLDRMRERRMLQEQPRRLSLLVLPGQPHADVDGLHDAQRRFFRDQHRAVEPSRQQDGGLGDREPSAWRI